MSNRACSCGTYGSLSTDRLPHLETAGDIYFKDLNLQWKVREFSTEAFYKSPTFSVLQRSWFLVCYSSSMSKRKSGDSTGIYLMLGESCPRLVLEIVLDLKTATGERVPLFSGIGSYYKKNHGWGAKTAIRKSTLQDKNEELLPFNSLTIGVTLKIIFQDYKQSASQRKLEENVCLNLKDILNSGKNADVIFKLENKDFRAHRLILQSRSPVFATMFDVEMEEKLSGVVHITDIKPDIFELVLSYLYCGEVADITTDSVCEVFGAAHKYELKDLMDWCISFLEDNLSSNTICDTFVLADFYDLKDLQKLALQYFAENSAEVLDTGEWKKLASENRSVALEILTCIVRKVTSV